MPPVGTVMLQLLQPHDQAETAFGQLQTRPLWASTQTKEAASPRIRPLVLQVQHDLLFPGSQAEERLSWDRQHAKWVLCH